MKFESLPAIDKMLDLYRKPAGMERFREYIDLLEGGNKGEMSLPIMNYNPMAKAHITGKLFELKDLEAEEIISETVLEINDLLPENPGQIFKVVLNLADDLKGGWTNRYTTDYESKFKIQALVKRNFCTSVFWSSEPYSTELIRTRTFESCLRTHYNFLHSNPVTLEDHILQENSVYKKTPGGLKFENCDFDFLTQFYEQNKKTDNYVIIFNFLYGDDAAEKLGYDGLRIKDEMAGFNFAKWIHSQF